MKMCTIEKSVAKATHSFHTLFITFSYNKIVVDYNMAKSNYIA